MRVLKIGFFQNDLLASCQPHARLLFAGLWCLADREGRLEDRPLRIKGELFPYEAIDVDKLIDELAQKGFVIRYQAEGMPLLEIPRFCKHQRPHQNEPQSTIPSRTCENGASPSTMQGGHGAFNSNRTEQDSGTATATGDAAADLFSTNQDKQSLIEALVVAGMSPTLAKRHVAETSDPALIREILAFHAAEITTFRNPVGALRAMLKDPSQWGFERTEFGKWNRPASKNVPKSALLATERQKRDRQQSEDRIQTRMELGRGMGFKGERLRQFVSTGK